DATPERKQAVDFPESPLLYYSLAVLARDDLPAKTWEDLNKPGVRIAVPQASSMDRFVSEHAAKADLQRFPDNAAAIAAFQSGRVDAVCLFHPPLLAARQRLGKGKIVGPTAAAALPCPVPPRRGGGPASASARARSWCRRRRSRRLPVRPSARTMRSSWPGSISSSPASTRGAKRKS